MCYIAKITTISSIKDCKYKKSVSCKFLIEKYNLFKLKVSASTRKQEVLRFRCVSHTL